MTTKRLFCSLFVLSFLAFAESCKKDIQHPNPTAAFDSKLIRQKWIWTSFTQSFSAYPKGNSRQAYPSDAYSDFRADNKVYTYFPPGFDTSGYHLRDSTLTFFHLHNGQVTNSSDAKVLTLNANALVFSFPVALFVEDTLTGIETIYTGEVIDSLHK